MVGKSYGTSYLVNLVDFSPWARFFSPLLMPKEAHTHKQTKSKQTNPNKQTIEP